MSRSPATKGAVLVTGTSTGIGRSVALRLAAHGYHVFAGVRKDSDGAALRKATTGALTPVCVDVTVEQQIKDAAEFIAEETSGRGLAGLVNNAGAGATAPFEVASMHEVRQVFDINFFGQLALTQEFLPQLRQRGGRLINIGSIGNRVVMPFAGPLNASKWAFAAFNHALRAELVPWGIHVVLVEPASIKTAAVGKLEEDGLRVIDRFTDRQRELYETAFRSMLGNATKQIQRLGTSPEAVARVVLRALVAEQPKPHYLVGRPSRPLAALVKWAPTRVYDKARLRIFGLSTEFGSRSGKRSV